MGRDFTVIGKNNICKKALPAIDDDPFNSWLWKWKEHIAMVACPVPFVNRSTSRHPQRWVPRGLQRIADLIFFQKVIFVGQNFLI